MQYDRLYDLGEDFALPDAFRGDPTEGVIEDVFALLGGSEKHSEPIRFEYHYSGGTAVCDVVWTTFGASVLVSDRVVTNLREGHFSGWTTYPVELYDKSRIRIPDYHGLVVTGRSGAIDRSRSEKVRHPIIPGTKPADFWRGLFFKDDRWDGSDIFLPEGTGYIIVVERVKNALESLSIPNIKFERLDTHETHI